MKVVFTPESEQQADYCDLWWRENRPSAAGLFASELADAKLRLASSPNIGAIYTIENNQTMRRILLKKTRNHVYFVVDLELEVVTIYSIWGAVKGRGPKLSP